MQKNTPPIASFNEAFNYQLDARGHRGTRAIQRLVEYAPASGGLALWMQHRDVERMPAQAHFVNADNRDKEAINSRKPFIIANDGSTLFYGPRFSDRSLEEQTGLVAHQVLHVALRHVDREQQLRSRLGHIDAELFAVCADAIVNASLSHLTWLQLPKGSVYLDTLLSHVLGIEQTLDVSLHQWDTEALYRAIDDRQIDNRASSNQSQQHSQNADEQQSENASASSSHNGQHSTDTEQAGNMSAQQQDSKNPSEKYEDGPKSHATRQLAATIIRDLIPAASETPETRTDKSMQWSERLLLAHTADAEQSFMRQLLADNTMSKTPWEQVLRTRLQRALSLQPDINWSRPTRSWLANRGRTSSGHRLPWQPGTSYSRHTPRLCIMVDVSGSVEDRLMQRFANEIDRIIRTFRTDALLIIGDDQVQEQHTLNSGVNELRSIQFTGGGATNFVPMIAAASAYKPDIGLFLTDLEGPAGDPPIWPIVWAVPVEANVQPVPFGQRIILD